MFLFIDPGHLDFLQAARAEGDYLIVGLQPDSVKMLQIFIKVPL